MVRSHSACHQCLEVHPSHPSHLLAHTRAVHPALPCLLSVTLALNLISPRRSSREPATRWPSSTSLIAGAMVPTPAFCTTSSTLLHLTMPLVTCELALCPC